MATEPFRVKPFNVFIDGKKIATMETSKYGIAGNDEEHISAEGWCVSDGSTTTSLDVGTIVPIDGKTHVLVEAIIKKRYLKVQTGIVDGKIHYSVMRCMEASYDTDFKGGSLKGSFQFKGGKPSFT